LPVYIVKGVSTSGHVADLSPLQIGIFDKKTNSVATASGNGVEFYIAGGSPHTKDSLSKFYSGLQHRKETEPFSGKDIISFHKILPTKTATEQWVLGYDGSLESKSLRFEADKTYKLKIRLFGEPVFRAFNKSLEKIIPLYTEPSTRTDCDEDCLPENLEVKKQTLKWVDAINNNTELREFSVKAEALFSDYAATTPNRFVYDLTVSDNGGIEALQDIQRAYPTETVERTSYQNGKSVYTITGKTSSPTAYTPKVYAYAVENCDECKSGIFVDVQYTYIVKRQLSATTNLEDATAEAAFAAAVVSDYSGVSGSGVYLGKSNGTGLVKFRKNSTAITAPANDTSDTVEEIAQTPAQCTPSSASPISWASVASGYVGTRTAKITLSDEDCTQSYTVDSVTGILEGVLPSGSFSVTDVTDNGESCVQVFQVVQNSEFTQDLYCMTKGALIFKDLPNFGHSEWKIVESSGSYDANVKAGIRFTAPFISQIFGDCAYDLNEYWDSDPVRMEIALLLDNPTPAELETLPVAKRVKAPSYQRGYGVGVRKTYIKKNSAYFPSEEFSNSARMREAIDNTALSQIKSDAYYIEYVLTYKSLRTKTNQKQETWATRFFVEAGDLAIIASFENSMQSVTSKFGVNLELLG